MGLSWKAKRRGKIYCAPACGAGCTVEQHRIAENAAAELVSELQRLGIGEGWKPLVWENLGWHARAVDATGRMAVHCNRTKSYTALLGGLDGARWAEDGRTPRAALRNVLATARAQKQYIDSLLQGW